jgi:hypothetical protein
MPKLKWPETLRSAVEMYGMPKGLPSSTYYAWLSEERQPNIYRLGEVANDLGVRLEYLVTGQGPASADAWAVVKRALFQIDGIFEEWDPPVGAEAREAKRLFRAGFNREREALYKRLGPIVQLVFGDMVARIMHCYRTNRRGYVHDPAWRGDLVGRALDYYFNQAGRVDSRAGFDKQPWSTRAWLTAIVADMGRWENGALPPDGDPFPRD